MVIKRGERKKPRADVKRDCNPEGFFLPRSERDSTKAVVAMRCHRVECASYNQTHSIQSGAKNTRFSSYGSVYGD